MQTHDTTTFFPAFRDEAERWLARFGLVGWQIRIMCATEEENEYLKDSKAVCAANREGRCADIILNAAWDEEPSDFMVRRSAFHEVCELLLFRFHWLAEDKRSTGDDLVEETHIIIRTLENAVFAREYGA